MNKTADTERYLSVDGFEVTEVPDGYVIYDNKTQKVHYLNPTAAVVYMLCDGKKTVADIRSFLKDSFELPDLPDIANVLSAFMKAGLVCPST